MKNNSLIYFFILGVFAKYVKSDLEVPAASKNFISLYLLFSIGFKGRQELQHSEFTSEIFYSLVLGATLATIIPLYTFFS